MSNDAFQSKKKKEKRKKKKEKEIKKEFFKGVMTRPYVYTNYPRMIHDSLYGVPTNTKI